MTIVKRDKNTYFVENHRTAALLEFNEEQLVNYLLQQEIAIEDIVSALTDMVREGTFVAEFGTSGLLFTRGAENFVQLAV